MLNNFYQAENNDSKEQLADILSDNKHNPGTCEVLWVCDGYNIPIFFKCPVSLILGVGSGYDPWWPSIPAIPIPRFHIQDCKCLLWSRGQEDQHMPQASSCSLQTTRQILLVTLNPWASGNLSLFPQKPEHPVHSDFPWQQALTSISAYSILFLSVLTPITSRLFICIMLCLAPGAEPVNGIILQPPWCLALPILMLTLSSPPFY